MNPMIQQFTRRASATLTWKRTTFLALLALLAVFGIVTINGVAYADGEASGLLQTYAVDGSPLNIVVEDSNSAWFTLPQSNEIGSLVLQSDGSHTIQKYALPTAGSEPHDLVIDGDTLWFTQHNGNRIGKFNITGATFDEYAIPTVSSSPTGIDRAPNGKIWFLESDARKLAVFDPSDNSFAEFPLPGTIAASELVKVKAASSNLIWFTMPDANRLVSYDVQRNQFSQANTISPTGSFTRPIGLVIDGSNRPWTTASASDVIGRYTPETNTFFRWFWVPTENSGVANLAYDDLGTNWAIFFTEANSGKVGRRVVRASDHRAVSVAEYSIGAANSSPWGIDVDADHKAWIADPGADLIAVWHAPYTDLVYLPTINK